MWYLYMVSLAVFDVSLRSYIAIDGPCAPALGCKRHVAQMCEEPQCIPWMTMRRAGGMGENRKVEIFWSLSDAISNRWRDIPPSLKNLFQLEGHDGLVLVD
jgi:hypothetical protein